MEMEWKGDENEKKGKKSVKEGYYKDSEEKREKKTVRKK